MNFIQNKINITIQNLLGSMDKIVQKIEPLLFTPCGYNQTHTTPNVTSEWQEYHDIKEICGNDEHYWIYACFTTPPEIVGKEIILKFTTGASGWDAQNPQGMLYLNGEKIQGLDVNHTYLALEPDTKYEMFVNFYTGLVGVESHLTSSVVLRDIDVEHLYYDMLVPFDALKLFEERDYNYTEPLKHLEIAANLIDLRNTQSQEFYKSVKAAINYLYKNFYNGVCGKSTSVVNCIGHTHIDVAWLWTLAQTREKTQRSFSTVINLMKKYPEYKFMSSQPQLYKYMKEEAPEIYEEIKKRVKEGRWEVEGAMWLEADCNLSSGESLVRQVMFGKRFMKAEFDVDSKVLWLPDVFGYSAALPQILQKSGVDKFVTSKISWNEFNKMPVDTFMWEGIDGTEIFTQFITAQFHHQKGENDSFTTYVCYMEPSMILGTWERYQQKEYSNETILTFGHGDGGGGPEPAMLEKQRRLAYGLPGLPKTKIETATKYLASTKKSFDKNCKMLKRTPRWKGELYLELHRGTYTSIAKNKRNNRKSELLFQKAESLSAFDTILLDGSYDQDKINNGWETILLNQFHDILPGSSIFEVYEDCDRDYARIQESGSGIVSEKMSKIAKNVNTNGGLFVYNPLWFDASSVVEFDGKKIDTGIIPAFGWKVIKPQNNSCKIRVSKKCIENKYYIIKLDEKAQITSIYDKKNKREVIKSGEAANRIEIFEDYPKDYDAWEITDYYKQKMWIIDDVSSLKLFDNGECAGLEIVRKYNNSEISQRLTVYNNSPRIDFVTTADWHEEHLLLKASFPLDIHTGKATYDIQFGSLERNTHDNTSWDKGKFEVCAHKWVDLSEDGYGVSLLNDCKYGHSAEGSTIKLSLIKCATYPNPHADKGIHNFTYSLYPHAGNYKQAGTINQAYLLNVPFETTAISSFQNGVLQDECSMISCDSENVVIETFKKAEDTNDFVIRMYEAFDRRTNVTFKFGFDVSKAYICDLMENNLSEVDVKDNTITFPIRNFEILTLKLSR